MTGNLLTPDEPPVAAPAIGRGAALVSHGSRLADDLAFAAELGLQQVRIDVPWAAAQPKAGTIDGDAVAKAIKNHGLDPESPDPRTR